MVQQRLMLVSAVLAVLAGGCTNGSDSSVEPGRTVEVVREPEILNEFWVEARTLSLPPGVAWPTQPPLPEPGPGLFGNPPGNGYEAGFGTTMADAMWFCVWSNEWLVQRTKDAGGAQTALNMMSAYKTKKEYLSADAGYRDNVDRMLAQAAIGDPTMVAQFVTHCGRFLRAFGVGASASASP